MVQGIVSFFFFLIIVFFDYITMLYSFKTQFQFPKLLLYGSKKNFISFRTIPSCSNLFFMLKFIMELEYLDLNICVSLVQPIHLSLFLWTSSNQQCNWASGNSMINCRHVLIIP